VWNGFGEFFSQQVGQPFHGEEERPILSWHSLCRVAKVRGKCEESRTVLFLIASNERLIFGVDQGEGLAPSLLSKRPEEMFEPLLVLSRQLYTLGCP